MELKDGVKAFCMGREEKEIIEIFGEDYNAEKHALLYKGNYYRIAIDDTVVTDAWIIFDDAFIRELEGCPTILCHGCGSDKYLYNKDGDQNKFCGKCGAELNWPQADKANENESIEIDERCKSCVRWHRIEGEKGFEKGNCEIKHKGNPRRANQKACRKHKPRIVKI